MARAGNADDMLAAGERLVGEGEAMRQAREAVDRVWREHPHLTYGEVRQLVETEAGEA